MCFCFNIVSFFVFRFVHKITFKRFGPLTRSCTLMTWVAALMWLLQPWCLHLSHQDCLQPLLRRKVPARHPSRPVVNPTTRRFLQAKHRSQSLPHSRHQKAVSRDPPKATGSYLFVPVVTSGLWWLNAICCSFLLIFYSMKQRQRRSDPAFKPGPQQGEGAGACWSHHHI